jgi:hypothetical protein
LDNDGKWGRRSLLRGAAVLAGAAATAPLLGGGAASAATALAGSGDADALFKAGGPGAGHVTGLDAAEEAEPLHLDHAVRALQAPLAVLALLWGSSACVVVLRDLGLPRLMRSFSGSCGTPGSVRIGLS